MKWVNHAVCTASIVYCFTGSFLFSGLSLIGVSIPDRLDGRAPDKGSEGFRYWIARHRGWSHFFLPYLLGIIILEFLVIPGVVPAHFSIYLYFLEFVFIGALFHILQDMICGRVPFWGNRHRFGLRLFEVGSWKEYVFSLFIFLACIKFDLFGFYYDLIWSFKHFVAEIL